MSEGTTVGKRSDLMWRVPDFRRLWVGQTLSMFGTNMIAVAVPLIAAVSLGASVFAMSLITATEFVPYLVISLFVGVWLDRRPKRQIIVLTDLVRAGALLVVPVAWWSGALSVPLLIAVVFVVGSCSVVADIGNAAILPSLVENADLMEGNSKLEVSQSVSNLAGLTVGGVVVQALTGPIAVLVNVFTYAAAALSTALIRKRETRPEPAEEPESVWRSMAEGIRFIFGYQTIRTLVIVTFVINFFVFATDPVFLYFIAADLKLAPWLVGVIMAASGAGWLLGALVAPRLSKRIPFGPLVIAAVTGIALSSMIAPVATLLPVVPAVALLIMAQASHSVTVIVANVNIRSYRSAVTPDDMQGRMNASARMLVMAGSPFGAFAGGALGSWLGTSAALVIGSAGLLVAAVVLGCSSVRQVKPIPDAALVA